MSGDDLLERVAQERRATGEDLVRHHTERVDVDAMVEARIGRHLLGRHVRRRAHGHSCRGERSVPTRVAHRLRDTEVGHHRVRASNEHVLGLDVSVHHALLVRVFERVSDFADDPHSLVDRQRTRARDAIAQRLPLHVRHHVEEHITLASRVVEREDVRMMQPRGDPDLAQESLGAEARGELGAQHLHRDVPVVFGVLGQVDGGHAARAELTLDDVSTGEGGGELCERV